MKYLLSCLNKACLLYKSILNKIFTPELRKLYITTVLSPKANFL